ncbi:MAG: universal stress protein [Acidimicrobiales bacterium]|nr:universal stress protein [Acidimicrobiales bacterium]
MTDTTSESSRPPSTERRIVVGVEGSGGARAALRFAIQEAKYRDAYIDVVTAYLSTYVPVAAEIGFTPLDPIDLVGEVEKMQQEVVQSVIDDDSVEIRTRLLKGRAAETLIEASEGAEMLVVGNRGRGGFRGLLLGSVSHQIAQHASCPVVIVRAELLPHEQDG